DFIREIIAGDRASGKNGGRVVTRFPPEPNGYLHIGHAKSICLNFGIAEENPGAVCRLRFDDTNPIKESTEYTESIKADVRWLGFSWEGEPRYTSGYFEMLYCFAEELIVAGKAYVCDLGADEIRAWRGTLTEPGRESPFRGRSVETNLDLFRRMRAGEFADGSRVLRAKIDMASPNMNLRDPTLYRIRRVTHHQTGDRWCIYPMYDFSHCLSDAIEGVTHSLCTLEFEDNRPLYDWVLDQVTLPGNRPRQIEFSRLQLEYTVVSKRRLLRLVTEGHVSGWDDPRMPTLAGMRRRGYTPGAIRAFARKIGVTKAEGRVELALLEYCLRQDLESRALRVMVVLDPLLVVIDNFPEGVEVVEFQAANHPGDPGMGSRKLAFTREIFIEREDFREDAPKKFKRLVPGGEVRLRYGYVIRCREVVKDPATGEVVRLHCTLDPETLHANPEGRKVKGVVHWVSASRQVPVRLRLYDRLFNKPDPEDVAEGESFIDHLNPGSLVELEARPAESFLASATAGVNYQFERVGYYCLDAKESAGGGLVFNRTVTLRDTWAKIAGREGEEG
ncbi:MAG: glutamine--tRNA ligase/YqeY domain fusion protein, partial [Magnetococcales bacterium]|nr:glutamine--tRNA ligase/YqeY domain fusion protein [Magnetococcales bacterium]